MINGIKVGEVGEARRGTHLAARADAILRRLPDCTATMAEVGVLRGHLSGELLKAKPRLVVVMIDNWQSSENQPEQYKATRDEHAFADARRAAAHKAEAELVTKAFGWRAPVLEMSSLEAADKIADASLDLVFLDADHSEAGVLEDLAAWIPKVKPGGWIGGHDYGNADRRYDFSGVARAVDRVFPEVELDLNFTWFKRIEGPSHG